MQLYQHNIQGECHAWILCFAGCGRRSRLVRASGSEIMKEQERASGSSESIGHAPQLGPIYGDARWSIKNKEVGNLGHA